MEILVLIVIAVVLHILSRRRKDRPTTLQATPAEQPVKTYTFEPTGVTHKCRFPDSRKSRQASLINSRIGDRVDLRVYEWQGNPAVAVINRRTGYDIGVASADTDRPALCDLMEQYRTEGVIKDITYFDYDGDSWRKAVVTIYCFPKEPAQA